MAMLCSCFRPSTRFEASAEAENVAPQTLKPDLDAAKKAPDAPVNAGRMAGKVVVDQSSARDTHAECDSPRKAAMQSVVAASPKPSTATALDAPPSIWEKLASHEIRSLSPTPEPKEMTTPAPATNNNNSNTAAVCKTPDLTITGHSIKPQPMPAGGVEAAGGRPVSAAAAAAAGKKPWGARTTPNSSGGGVDIGMTTPPSRRLSSGGGSARKSQAGQTPPSAGVPPSLLKPTAASAARAQATIKPRSDEAVWKH